LNKLQFKKAFRLGLGRAYLHVREHGDDGLQDIILRHCLKNPCYDPQGEGSRATWLMSVIDLCSEPSYYTDKIIKELERAEGDRDLLQLYDLCLIIAERGNKQARNAIYDRFDKQEFNEAWLGGDQIIRLDGIDGLTHVARILGQRMLDDSEYWDGMTYKHACEIFGKEKTDKYLGELSQKDKAVAAYLKDSLDIYKAWDSPKDINTAETLRKRTRKEIPFEVIQSDIEKAHKHKSRCLRFGRYATNEEIKILYKKMLNEERPEQLVLYLWLFRKRELPALDDKLFDLCCSENEDVYSSAITALSQSTHKRVRDFAIRKINSDEAFSLEIIELFINNYENGDAVYIERALFQDGDKEKVFSLSYDILNVFEENPEQEMLKCILWVYENTPCAHCRCRAVTLLTDQDILPEHIRNECLHDCCEEIKSLCA